MGEGIAVENGQFSDFQGLVTLTLTLDRVILHTVMHHSSTSTYMPNFIEIEQTVCGRTDVQTGGWTFETHFIRSTRRRRPNNDSYLLSHLSIMHHGQRTTKFNFHTFINYNVPTIFHKFLSDC